VIYNLLGVIAAFVAIMLSMPSEGFSGFYGEVSFGVFINIVAWFLLIFHLTGLIKEVIGE
jgi:hypothetical protein